MIKEESRLFEKSSSLVAEIWLEIKEEIERLGNVNYEYKKTSIHCMKKVAFIGVHPKKNWLDLNIVLDRSLNGIVDCKVEQVSKNRFHNEIRILNKEQIPLVFEYVKESFLQGR